MTHFVTPLRLYVSAPASGRHMLDHIEQGVDAETSNDNAQARFPESSHVTSTGTLQTTFLVDENHVPINIENIPSIYTFLKLLFII